jgi:hypothetical protein
MQEIEIILIHNLNATWQYTFAATSFAKHFHTRPVVSCVHKKKNHQNRGEADHRRKMYERKESSMDNMSVLKVYILKEADFLVNLRC